MEIPIKSKLFSLSILLNNDLDNTVLYRSQGLLALHLLPKSLTVSYSPTPFLILLAVRSLWP